MIEDHREWSFGKLLTEYMGEWVFFGMNGSFDKLPWSLRIEVRRIVSVLNALVGVMILQQPKGSKRLSMLLNKGSISEIINAPMNS